MLEVCAACGAELPVDGAACSCQTGAGPAAPAWGGLDFDPARERQARAQRGGSVVQRLPDPPSGELGDLAERQFFSPTTQAQPQQPQLQLAPRPVPARPVSRPRGDSKPLQERPPSRPIDPRSASRRIQPNSERRERAPEPRAASRPLGDAARGARTSNTEASRPVRADSGALRIEHLASGDVRGAPQHPALRGARPQNQNTRAKSGPLAQPENQAAADANAAAALSLDTGWTGFGNPFSDQALDQSGPMPELEMPSARELAPTLAQPGHPANPAAPPVNAAADANTQRQQRIAALSKFGPAPATLLQALPYCLRVIKRKHALGDNLALHVRSRQQLELAAEQALCTFGEALYARRTEAGLELLQAQLRAVVGAREGVGSSVKAGKRVAEARKREFETLSRTVDQKRQLSAPIERHGRELEERLGTGRARVRDLEERMRALEAEQKTLKSATDAATLERLQALEDARQAAWGEVQSLQLELAPISEDHTRAQAEVAQHAAAISDLQAQQARLMDVVERDEERHKLATGGAQSAYRAALSGLALAALREDLGHFASPQATQYISAHAPIAGALEQESLLRAAIQSYDHAGYKRGVQLIVASTFALFVVFTLLVVL